MRSAFESVDLNQFDCPTLYEWTSPYTENPEGTNRGRENSLFLPDCLHGQNTSLILLGTRLTHCLLSFLGIGTHTGINQWLSWIPWPRILDGRGELFGLHNQTNQFIIIPLYLPLFLLLWRILQ